MRRQSATVCLIKSPTRQQRGTTDLAERLRALPDPRGQRGRRHSFVSVLLVARSAVVARARSFAAIGQWAANAPQDALARLGAPTATAFDIQVAPRSPAQLTSSPAYGRGVPAVARWASCFTDDCPVREDSR
ncbi:transposase family protein [Actinacidiphila soli]|uniref:transposase family protein n=1 Tax=Actinacidiphila soli TaxID=2487275 RepID=UPI001F0C7182|nr:transposase family protein [Actinacidiphila soli]